MSEEDLKIEWERWVEIDNNNDDDSQEYLQENHHRTSSSDPAILTPLGGYHKNDPLAPSNLCECWWVYTNFKLDKRHNNRLKETVGAEVMSVLTSYRLFIGIGKLFNTGDVKIAIEEALILAESDEIDSIQQEEPNLIEFREFMEGVSNNPLEFNEEIFDVISKMQDEQYERWAILVNHDGDISAVTTHQKDDDDYAQLLSEMLTEAEEIDGLCITSEDGSVSF
jgi:hypothetical protein